MAQKLAPSMGNSIVASEIISVTSTIPVSGARTTGREEGGHADDGETDGLDVKLRKGKFGDLTADQSELRAEDEHGRKYASRRGGRVRGGREPEAEQKHQAQRGERLPP